MRALLVEDDLRLRGQLREKLEETGYVVDEAGDGEEGLYYGREYDYDAAVIDLGLPKLGGMDLIVRLRGDDRRFPILILTARDHWQDKVEALEAGADDYLTKPFRAEELLARLNALVRRAAGYASPVICDGGLVLNTTKMEVRVNEAPVELTAYEYRVLEYLALNPDRVISKTELIDHLYDQDFERDSNVIEVFVGRLRKKLLPLTPIHTVRGRGYRFTTDPAA